MFEEERNIDLSRPHERPPGFGHTVVLRPSDPSELLARFRAVWRIVASWGRSCDEEAGAWPSNEECLAMLPNDFVQALVSSRSHDVDGWLDDLHDRDWVLWSSARVGEQVKIDLDADSMPISSAPIRLVAEVLGAEVVFADVWREDATPLDRDFTSSPKLRGDEELT